MSDMAYIARRPCGCIVIAIVDEPRHAKDTAKDVAKAIRQGYAVERVTIEVVRAGPWECSVCRPPKTVAMFQGVQA